MYNELVKGCLAFQLKDGNIIWISKEDCNEIANKIIIENLVKTDTVVLMEKDNGIQKANVLIQLLKDEKDMSKEQRSKYLKQIGEFLTGENSTYINIKTKQEVIIVPEKNTKLK